MDLAPELIADDGELVQGRVKEGGSRPGIVRQHDVEHGHQKKQERKHAQEGREGEVGDEDAGIVVTEFLHDADDDGGGPESLLCDVDSPHRLLEWTHTLFLRGSHVPEEGAT